MVAITQNGINRNLTNNEKNGWSQKAIVLLDLRMKKL